MYPRRPKDLYKVLGVSRDAHSKDIKARYRELAKQYHPDKNPGDKRAEERFKEIQGAYSVLSDPDKRRQHDRKLRLFEQRPTFGPFTTPSGARYRRRADGTYVRQNEESQSAGRGGFFEWLFGAQERARRITVTLPFKKAFRGGPTKVKVSPEKTVRVTLPEGVRDGYTIRIKDVAGPPLHVRFKVKPHKSFKMRGDDLIVTTKLKVGVMEAMLGAVHQVAHPSGTPVTVRVPPGTQPGTRLRLRGKGVREGDMVVQVQVRVPTDLTAPQRKALEQAAKATGIS